MQTLEEQVEAMKAKVAAQQAAERAEADRRARVEAAPEHLRRGLVARATETGMMHVPLRGGKAKLHFTSGTDFLAHPRGVPCITANAYGGGGDVAMGSFLVRVNHDGTEAWLEHDGERIDVEVALGIVADNMEKNL